MRRLDIRFRSNVSTNVKKINFRTQNLIIYGVKEKIKKNETRERECNVIIVNVFDILRLNVHILLESKRSTIPLSLMMSQMKKVNPIKQTVWWYSLLA